MTPVAGKRRTPQAFKQALDAQIVRAADREGRDANTVRLRLVIQRFLARLFHREDVPWLLKGGFAMELRFRRRARATRDVDLMIGRGALGARPTGEDLQELLQHDLGNDLGDHLAFQVIRKPDVLTAPPEGGSRFQCRGVLLGKACGTFAVDVGCGDAVDDPPDVLDLEPVVPMPEFAAARVRVVSAFQQFAEKCHAYTLPWSDRVNTRTKDLVDLVLLLPEVETAPGRLRAALRATFSTRNKQPLPSRLPDPPTSWAEEFRHLATQIQLAVTEYREAFSLVQAFWEEHSLGGDGG